MPFVIPMFAAIGSALTAAAPAISAVGALTGAGLGIENAINAPGAPKIPAQSPSAGVMNQQQQQQIKAAESAAAPNLQANMGLALNPMYENAMLPVLSGTSGMPGVSGITPDIINQIFGFGGGAGAPATAPITPSGTTSGPNLAATGLSNLQQSVLGG